jgi:hypothetical protein
MEVKQTMCDCIKKIAEEHYIHLDYFHKNTYLIYPIVWNNGKSKVFSMGLLINFCPVCGEKVNMQIERKVIK